MIDPAWTCYEPGWWTHPEHGGLCREDDRRWYHCPKSTVVKTPWGDLQMYTTITVEAESWPTLREAMAALDEQANGGGDE